MALTTEDLKWRVRRTLGDLQIAKDNNDRMLILAAKESLGRDEAELARRRRDRRRRMGFIVQEPQEG